MIIYLRDLKDTIREGIEDAIKNGNNKELKKAVEDCDDILIADIRSDFSIINIELEAY